MIERILLISIFLLQFLTLFGVFYIYKQTETHVLVPAQNVASTIQDAATISTQGPLQGAMYVAQHPKTAAVWQYVSETASNLRKHTEI